MEFAFTIPGSSEPATVDAVGFYVAGHTHKVKVSDARQSNARQSNARQSNACVAIPNFFWHILLRSSLCTSSLPPTLCFAHSLFLPHCASLTRSSSLGGALRSGWKRDCILQSIQREGNLRYKGGQVLRV
jgi:hypothetical protein